jgi:hypothetical protein
MNTTKSLFSELVSDFQSERWNQVRIAEALCARASSPGETSWLPFLRDQRKRSSFASSHNVNCASNSLASKTTLTSWQVPIGANPCAICAGKPVFGARATNALFRQASSIGVIGAEREGKRF